MQQMQTDEEKRAFLQSQNRKTKLLVQRVQSGGDGEVEKESGGESVRQKVQTKRQGEGVEKAVYAEREGQGCEAQG